MIEGFINSTLEQFDFAYCLTVNILTYIIINIIIAKFGNDKVGTWIKRGVLLVCIILVGLFYNYYGIDKKILLNSAILTPVFWSWIMKPICKRFNLDYKQLSLFD